MHAANLFFPHDCLWSRTENSQWPGDYKKAGHAFKCADSPHEQVYGLWRQPRSEFPFGQWQHFDWRVKWSAMSNANHGSHRNGSIQLSINGTQVVNWVGPIGRNDGGRLPYFKIGVYNPSGITGQTEVLFRNYSQSWKSDEDITDSTATTAADEKKRQVARQHHEQQRRTWVVDAAKGDDAAAGTALFPFRTLDRARAAVLAWQGGGERRVLLRGGAEHAPLRLDSADGGRSSAEHVVYSSFPGETAVISGGFRVPPTAVKVVPHPRPHNGSKPMSVLHVALARFGFGPQEYGALAGDTQSGPDTNPATPGEFGCANRKMEAHLAAGAGTTLSLARYPNAWPNGTWRWMHLDRPSGWSAACMNHSRHPVSCSDGGCCASNSSFISDAHDPRPAGWLDEPDPWLHGYFQQDWADTIARVDSITWGPAKGSFSVQIDSATPTYGTKPIQSGARWVGLNMFSELDDERSGEYWLDRSTGDLYVVPPGGATAISARDLGLVVSVNESCVNSNASNVRFEHLGEKLRAALYSSSLLLCIGPTTTLARARAISNFY